MFRPLMWPSSRKCVTHQHIFVWRVISYIRTTYRISQKYFIWILIFNAYFNCIFLKNLIFHIFALVPLTSVIYRCTCPLYCTSVKMTTWVAETCRRYTACIIHFYTLMRICWFCYHTKNITLSLPIPWKRIGRTDEQLHSFLTLTIVGGEGLSTLRPLHRVQRTPIKVKVKVKLYSFL
jgi:hypothetical protein